jgi:hypothetical protein
MSPYLPNQLTLGRRHCFASLPKKQNSLERIRAEVKQRLTSLKRIVASGHQEWATITVPDLCPISTSFARSQGE